jgi:glucosylceramidase
MKVQKRYLFVPFLLLMAAVPLIAQTAQQLTTIEATAAPYCIPWVDSGFKAGAAWTTATNYVEIFPATEYQEMYGFGGTFYELGWAAISHLDSAGKDSVMRALFDTAGANLSWGRIPVGVCDYDFAVTPYTPDDNAGDTSMSLFSMARDSLRKIPYIKYAQAIRAAEGQPAMRFFASPWSPPAWMKTNDNIGGATNGTGNFVSSSANCRAYALYLDKWIKGYAAAGINVETITCQNEQDQTSHGYPQCGWTEGQEDSFYSKYLIPRFSADSLSARILLGVYCCADYVQQLLGDAVVKNFVNWTSHSYESTTDGPTYISYDNKIPFLESESMWNPAGETWSVGTTLFGNIQSFMAESTSMYTVWQCVDNVNGTNGGWTNSLGGQPEMITIDTTKTPSPVVYSPEFYACKHYSHFLKAGAFFVKSTNHGTAPTTSSAFLNPDGSIIYVAEATAATALTIKVGTEMYTVNLPANSFNTIKITNSTAVRDIQLARNSAASQLNNLRIRNSTLYFSLSPAMNAMEANLTLSDIQGRMLWTGHRSGSALRGGQQSFAIGTAHGSLPSGTYLLSAKIKNVAGAVVTVEKKVSTVN